MNVGFEADNADHKKLFDDLYGMGKSLANRIIIPSDPFATLLKILVYFVILDIPSKSLLIIFVLQINTRISSKRYIKNLPNLLL